MKALKEIKNWFYIRRIVKQEKKTSDSGWNEFNLRSNWYGRIYTVVSLREEDMGEEEVVRNWRAMEAMRPINDYLTTLDFKEIIYPSIEKIPNSRSYLVVYSPVITSSTIRTLIYTTFLILAGIITLIFI